MDLFEETNKTNEKEENLEINFDKALKKKQFKGEKGKMLLELQNSYGNDLRFKFNKNFENDVEIKKIPKSLKKQSDLFDKKALNNILIKENNKSKFEMNHNEKNFKEEIEKEKNNNFAILSSLIPTEDFLKIENNKILNPKNLLIKRFDPTLNIGKHLIKPEPEIKKKYNKDNIIKLKKGVQQFNEMNEEKEKNLLKKVSKKEMKISKEKNEKLLDKAINELNNGIEQKVEINYSSWKNIIKKTENEETNKAFCLFGENNILKETNLKQSKIKSNKNNIKEEDNKKVLPDFDNNLNKKRKREEEREKFKKEKFEKKNLKIKLEEREKITKEVLKTNLLKAFDDEKVENYIKYVDMVRDKRKKEIK